VSQASIMGHNMSQKFFQFDLAAYSRIVRLLETQ
jgi:hypothetical protein